MIAGLIFGLLEAVGKETGKTNLQLAGSIGSELFAAAGIDTDGKTVHQIMGDLIAAKDAEVARMKKTGQDRKDSLERLKAREVAERGN